MMIGPLPFIWTQGLRRAWHRLNDLATGDTGVVLLYGESGAGKSELLKRFSREWAWQAPIDYYVRKIRHGTWMPDLCFEEVLELSEKSGVLDGNTMDHGKFLLANRFRMEGVRQLSRWVAWQWIHWLADRLGRPAPSPLAGLPIWGITEEVRGRYPLIIEGQVEDSPRVFLMKLLRQIEPPEDRRQEPSGRWLRLDGFLEDMPVLLIVDEADMLKPETLHSIRQLCDRTRTPLILAGTRLLESRLQRDPRLWPLATRIGTQIQLGAVTLKDLQAALPDLGEQIVLAVWQAGRGQFRTITLLLKELHKFQEANPGRRLTRTAVALAAGHLVAAAPLRPMTEEEELGVPARSSAVARQARKLAPAVADIPSVAVAVRTK